VAKSGTVTDYAGEELYAGDLVVYATRCKNLVRMTDAVVQRVETRRYGGKVHPVLLVKPTGAESGFLRRKTRNARWIAADHVRLVAPEGEF
jgi:hypothetical protein